MYEAKGPRLRAGNAFPERAKGSPATGNGRCWAIISSCAALTQRVLQLEMMKREMSSKVLLPPRLNGTNVKLDDACSVINIVVSAEKNR